MLSGMAEKVSIFFGSATGFFTSFLTADGSNWLKKSSAPKSMSSFLAPRSIGFPYDFPKKRLPKLSFYISVIFLEELFDSDLIEADTFFIIVSFSSFAGKFFCSPEKSKMSDSSTNALGFFAATTGSGFSSSTTGFGLPPVIIILDLGA